MEMGEEMGGEKMWKQLSIYTGQKKKKGFHRISALSSVSQTHKFNKIINRILSCRSPLIQPLSHSWAGQPLTHEGPHVWWGTPLPHKTHLEQKIFVRGLKKCNVKEGEICNVKEREIVKISANVVTFKYHF